ncbi:sensor histidine kinase, PAS domain-containing [Citrifermentans bemidjiense Bem]|uniref:histidine kinase n=1 Tax=Citrifermentans bemidjiense (strain ATCC BAA-1014 / DSM 16622 / JCM 12645 / Bem) TaxID=404380 RepID=B5EGB8_CITBB|nr:PAS domain-containing sensor histidine kinase [Citrifermentans bemidjiense]ACH41031.1 sensor histidine kinase, PAS domain-containing [Citrifermentans bemidjiense Bem]
MKNGSPTDKQALEQQLTALRRENEELAQQVKRLIRAEGKLYEYQQVLDLQLNEYKGLYDLSRRLSGSFYIQGLFRETVQYVVQQLEYERAILLRREETVTYRVLALDGYYDPSEKEQAAAITMKYGAPCLSPLLAGREHVTCTATSTEPGNGCRRRLLMDEFLVYPLGHDEVPHALLVVGNTATNAPFHRRVQESDQALLSMGNLVGLVSSILDTHIFFERMMEAREQERVAEAKYRSLFENAAEGIFRRTPEGRYLDANPALAHMLGYASPAELVASITDIGTEVYVDPASYAEMQRVLAVHGRAESFETQIYRKDGSVIWVSLSLRAVRDSEGKVLFYEGMSEEITKRKIAEAALRESEQKYRQLSEALERRVKQAVDELRQKDKMLILQGRQAVMGEMLSNIAHQWRQPLNMLALLVQDVQLTHRQTGLSEEFICENVRRSMEIIQQMSQTIDDFRYFYRPDREKLEFTVSEPLDKALALLNGSLRIHSIEIQVLKTGEPSIKGYLGEFVQVLLNILINARDALIASRAASPLITVRLYEEGGETVVRIADNAGGIPEEIKEKIFEPYFTTKGPEQGTGIGLFMCKTIIEKSMNGRLCASNSGEGAEFVITVPKTP